MCLTDYLVICGRAFARPIDPAKVTRVPSIATRTSSLNLSAPRNAPSCRCSSYRNLLPINPGSECERRITCGLLVTREVCRRGSWVCSLISQRHDGIDVCRAAAPEDNTPEMRPYIAESKLRYKQPGRWN